MNNVAFVFPGQGSQYVGMGRQLASSFPSAAAVFAEADEALAEPLSRLCWEGDAAELDQTVNAQPALLAASIAYLRALEDTWTRAGEPPWKPHYYAGHSMGQYSALVAAGALSLPDGVRLVRERGRQMQASAENGAMAAVIGLADESVEELLRAGARDGDCVLANRNSPGQIVISGERGAVEAAVDAARGLGAKRALLLPVSVAAHSPLMARAADAMREVLAQVDFADPAAPLLANADGRLLTTGDECRNELVEHLTRGVDWVRAVEQMTAAGISTFVEVGPGKVLTGLIKRIAPDAEALSVDDPKAEGGLALPAFQTSAAAPA